MSDRASLGLAKAARSSRTHLVDSRYGRFGKSEDWSEDLSSRLGIVRVPLPAAVAGSEQMSYRSTDCCDSSSGAGYAASCVQPQLAT